MSHAAQAANANAHAMQPQNPGEGAYTENAGTHNDSMLQIANIFMNKTASMSFLELQDVNGRKFHFGENIMKSILLPEHTSQNQNTSSYANNLLKRIHLQKIFIQPGFYVFCVVLCSTFVRRFKHDRRTTWGARCAQS